MNVAVPGVDPWSEVGHAQSLHLALRHPCDSQSARTAGERRGKGAAYFAFFFDTISAGPDGVSESAREMYVEAYSRPEAVHTGFDWYRAFPQDYVRPPVRTHRSQCSYALTFQIADLGIAN
jgi:hypothetical protein